MSKVNAEHYNECSVLKMESSVEQRHGLKHLSLCMIIIHRGEHSIIIVYNFNLLRLLLRIAYPLSHNVRWLVAGNTPISALYNATSIR
jgi:hypothetical protein